MILKIPIKIVRKIYGWCTKTRLRKILSSVLVFLILLTSIKYIFIYPNTAKAADVFIKLDEGYGTTPSDTNSTISAGTLNGASWRTDDMCKDGKCLYFDGDEDYVSYADDPDLDFAAADSFTITGWFRHTQATAVGSMVAKILDSDNDGGYIVQMQSDGDISCILEDDDADTTFDDTISSTLATYDDNIWHQFACVKSTTASLTLYIDGVEVAQSSSLAATGSLANDEPFIIGIRNAGGTTDYQGFLDEIKVYRSARTATEVKADFTGETPNRGVAASFEPNQEFTSNGLVGYWRMDETASPSIDYSGNGNSGTWQSSPAAAAGKFSNAIDLNGSTQYISGSASTSLTQTGNITISGWIYRDTAGQTDVIIDYALNSEAEAGNHLYTFTINSADNLSLDWEHGAGTNDSVTSSADISPTSGSWTHLAVTRNTATNEVKFFQNGIQLGTTQTFTNDPTGGTTSTLAIGRNESSATDYFDGKIDELRIYNREFSPSEIQTLYGWAPGPVGHWKLDENTGTTANDSSTNGNTGTLSGTTTPSWATGKYGAGNSFNGSTAYVGAGNGSSLQITNNLTLSSWIKLTSNSTTQDIIARNGASANYNYRLYVNSSGQAVMEVSSDGTATTTVTGSSTLSTNTWYHISGTYVPSTSMTIYVNGVQDGLNTTSIPASINNTSSVALKLGAENTGATVAGGAFVQACSNGATTLSTLTVTCATTAGNLLVIVLGANSGSSRTYLAEDSNGTDFTACAACDHRPSGITNTQILHYLLTTQNSTGVTVTVTGGAVSMAATVLEFSGVQSSPLDQGVVGFEDVAGVSGALTSGATGTTTQANEIAVGGLTTRNGSSTTGNGTGWTYATQFIQGTTIGIVGGYKVLTATGTETNTGTATGTPQWVATAATFKSNTPSTGNNFSGVIDDAKVYNYDRTPQQIVEDMNAGHPAPGSPVGSSVGYWKFDEGKGDTVYDNSIHTNNGGLAGSSAACPTGADDGCPSWTNSGKFEKALTFSKTGVDDYVEIADDSSLRPENGSWSVSFWANPADADQGGSFISKDQTSGDFERWTVFMCGDITCNTSGQLLWANFQQSGTVYRSALSTNDIADGTWHQYAAVFDKNNDKVRLFMDGRELTTTTATSGVWPTVNNTDPLRIGGQNIAGNYIETSIDEVQIYNSALSPDQIKLAHNRNSTAVMGAVSTDSSGNASFASIRSYCPPGNTDTNCGSGDPSPVGEWKLDDNTGTTASDTSANNSTGTFNGGVTWSTGKMGSGVKINGVSSSYVTMTDPADGSLDVGTGNFTIEAWVNLDPSSTVTIPSVVEKGGTSGAVAGYWLYYLNSASTLQFRVGDGTNRTGPNGTTNIKDGLWHHVAAVADRTGANMAYLYVDGRLEGSADISTVTGSADNALIFTLSSDVSNCAWLGSLDNVSLYKYVRSQSEIAWSYNYGKPVAWYKMDESLWNTTANEVKDSSGNGLHGTAAGNATTTASGKYNYAGTFDGTGDYFDASDNAKLDITADFTLSAWINLTTAAIGNQFIITKRSGTGGGGGYDIAIGNSSEVFCQTDNGTTTTSSSTPTGVISTSSGWQHVTAVRSGTSCRIYIDGVDRTTTAGTHTTLTANANAVRVGGNLNNSEYWNGQIDDARIYNYAMTAQQVKTLMNESAALRYGANN
jgi:hypothetical protein